MQLSPLLYSGILDLHCSPMHVKWYWATLCQLYNHSNRRPALDVLVCA